MGHEVIDGTSPAHMIGRDYPRNENGPSDTVEIVKGSSCELAPFGSLVVVVGGEKAECSNHEGNDPTDDWQGPVQSDFSVSVRGQEVASENPNKVRRASDPWLRVENAKEVCRVSVSEQVSSDVVLSEEYVRGYDTSDASSNHQTSSSSKREVQCNQNDRDHNVQLGVYGQVPSDAVTGNLLVDEVVDVQEVVPPTSLASVSLLHNLIWK